MVQHCVMLLAAHSNTAECLATAQAISGEVAARWSVRDTDALPALISAAYTQGALDLKPPHQSCPPKTINYLQVTY